MQRNGKRLVKISELARLAGVPAPTIKHYIREGLLPGPEQRTSRNMAYYDAGVAERVKVIKDLQQTRFLPLRVIGQILEPSPSAEIRQDLDEVARRQLGTLEPVVTATHDATRPRVAEAPTSMTRREVLANLAIDPADLAEMMRLNLVEPAEDEHGEPVFQGGDLRLMQVIDETRRLGLGDLFPMSILTPYAAAIRTLVRVELELFRSGVLEGPVPADLPVATIAEHAARLGEQLVLSLRQRLLITELRRITQPAPEEGDPDAGITH
jgi:DNA-binding transcriptional MerR regulator